MKTLCLYYSRTELTKEIMAEIAAGLYVQSGRECRRSGDDFSEIV